MILCFSGTSNSLFIAKRIQSITKDSLASLNEMIKNSCRGELTSDLPYVFVAPVYAWQMPHVVRDFIKSTQFYGNKKVYFVLSCGGEVANAGAYAKKLCDEKGLEFMGISSILMPDNYILMFPCPKETQAKEIISRSIPHIDESAACINEGKTFPLLKVSAVDKLKSSLINSAFYPMFVKAKGFHVSDKCVSCGACEKLCPLNNIKLVDGTPTWGTSCTHCMACICTCPAKAIEYKNKTQNKGRYYNDFDL